MSKKYKVLCLVGGGKFGAIPAKFLSYVSKQTDDKTIKDLDGIDFLSDYEKDTDVVFLDIMMPLEDGLSIAKKIRKENQTIIIIFVTNMKEYAIEGYSVNAFNFMLKPVVYGDFYLNLKKISKIIQCQMASDMPVARIIITGKWVSNDLLPLLKKIKIHQIWEIIIN